MRKIILLVVATLFIPSTFWAGILSPTTIEGAVTVSAEEAKILFDSEVLFVKLRKDSDWDAGRIPGAIHLNNKKGSASAVEWSLTSAYNLRADFPPGKTLDIPSNSHVF